MPTDDVPAAPTGSLHLATTTNASPASVLHFKLLTFSTVDTAIWFRRAEVQFRLRRVRSSHTQADHVLAAIPDTIFPQMSTWLDAKGDDMIEYQDLKAFLLQKFSPAERRVQMILDLSNQPLGDQRWDPSVAFHPTTLELLQKSTSFWPCGYDASPLLSVQPSQSSHPTTTTTWPNAPTVYSTPTLHPTLRPSPLLPPRFAQHFNASKRHFNRSVAQTPHPRSQKNASSTPSSFRKSSSTSRSCYYHERFGPTAKKCQHPCIWSKNVLWGHLLQRWAPYPLMLSFCLTPVQVFSSSSTPAHADPSFRSPGYTAAALPAPTQTS